MMITLRNALVVWLLVAAHAACVPAGDEDDDDRDDTVALDCPTSLYCSILDDDLRDAHCRAASAPECCFDDDCQGSDLCARHVCEDRPCLTDAHCPNRFAGGLGPCTASVDCPADALCVAFSSPRCFTFKGTPCESGSADIVLATTVEGTLVGLCQVTGCDPINHTCQELP
jgi:hypothetical protein